jgi:oxygen-dependent protoporphyrinogen oxidase
MNNVAKLFDTAPIFVIGSGPAGLAAAHRLQREGHRAIVLEALGRPGGMIRTCREAGYLMEEGATILPSSYKPMLDIVKEIGMTGRLVPAGAIVGFCREGKIHDLRSNRLFLDAVRSNLISGLSKLAMTRLGIDNARIRPHLNYEDLSETADFDTMTPKQYCEKHWGLSGEVYEYVIDSTVRGVLGTRGDKISLAELFFMINNILGSRLYAFINGFSEYVEAVAAPLDVRLNAKVQEIIETADGVRVTWVDHAGAAHVEDGAGAIVTVRGDWLPDLLPGYMDADCELFLRNLQYTKCVVMNTGLVKKPAGIAASVVQVPRLVDEGLMAFTCEHNKAPGRAPAGKGLIALMSMTEWAQTLIEEDDDSVRRKFLIAAEKVIPGISDDVDYTKISRWHNIVVYSHPGLYRQLGEFLKRRPRNTRIQLGGAFFSSTNLCSATAGGERAVRDLLPVIRGEIATRAHGPRLVST